jgi:hypothetical protein
MSDTFAYEGLTISVLREPDYSLEDDGAGGKMQVELPGRLRFGVVVDGVFVTLISRAAAGFDADVARAKAAAAAQAAPADTGATPATPSG